MYHVCLFQSLEYGHRTHLCDQLDPDRSVILGSKVKAMELAQLDRLGLTCHTLVGVTRGRV